MPKLKTHCKHGHEFTPDNTYISPQGIRYCRACKKRHKDEFLASEGGTQKQSGYRKKWLDKNPTYQCDYDLKSNYGITLERRNQMLDEQDGLCAICQIVLETPCVDHDHATGKVRQLLCQRCNRTLGQVNDNPGLLERMASYLRLHKEN